MPLLQVIQPVLPQLGELRRVSGEPSLVLVQPLLGENAYGGGRQAADEGREPEDVDSDSPRFRLRVCLWATWEDDRVCSIDEGSIGGEAVELLRDLLEDSDGGIDSRRGLKQEIGLDIECGEDRRVKTRLYGSLRH